MNKRLSLAVTVAAVVAVASVLAVAKQAAAPVDPETIQAPVAQLSSVQVQQQKAAVIAAAGRGVLQRIDAAYGLIGEGKIDEAAKAIGIAQQLLGQIVLALREDGADPTESTDEALSIPLYASLGIPEDVDVTPALQQGLEALSPLITRGDHQAVVERLKQFHVTITYRYVEMPLKAVGDEVDAAAKALKAGDKDGARAFLKAAAAANVSASMTVGGDGDRKHQG